MTAPVLQLIEYDTILGGFTITPVLNGVKSDQEYYFSSHEAAFEFIEFYRRSPIAAMFAMVHQAHLNRLYSNTLMY
mgnify:FL=1